MQRLGKTTLLLCALTAACSRLPETAAPATSTAITDEPVMSGLGGRTSILVRTPAGVIIGIDGLNQVPRSYRFHCGRCRRSAQASRSNALLPDRGFLSRLGCRLHPCGHDTAGRFHHARRVGGL